MTKVVLFNGPPGCGKDTAARFCVEKFGAKEGKMADPLKDAIASFFGVTREELERLKPEVCPYSLTGKTWREVMISLSEDWAKPLFGKEIFGHVSLARHVGPNRNTPWVITVSDSGFAEEALPWIRQFGPENVLLVRIYRPGHTFEGDSRSYLRLAEHGVPEIDFDNVGSFDDFHHGIKDIVAQFLNTNQENAA